MIQEAIQDWWREVVEYEYSLHIAVVLGIAAAFLGGRQGYHMYVASREGAAQVVMAEAFEEYDKAMYQLLDGKDSQEIIDQKLEDVQLGFNTVVASHGSSNLAPYAYAFEADVALQKSDKKGAIELLEKALTKMSAKAPGYYLIKTKLALVQLDAGQKEIALDQLRSLAFDKDNPNADSAAFYLGYYYWTVHDQVKAKEAWQQLEPSDKQGKRAVSPWLEVAQAKLQQIS